MYTISPLDDRIVGHILDAVPSVCKPAQVRYDYLLHRYVITVRDGRSFAFPESGGLDDIREVLADISGSLSPFELIPHGE